MARQADAGPFLTVPEAGVILRVSPARAYAMAAEGVFPTTRIAGRRIVVPRAAFEAWVREQGAKALANVRERAPA